MYVNRKSQIHAISFQIDLYIKVKVILKGYF